MSCGNLDLIIEFMKNPYFKKAHISTQIMEQLLEDFIADIPVEQVSENCSLSVRSIQSLFRRLRAQIAFFGWQFEDLSEKHQLNLNKMADEIYFTAIQRNNKVIIIPTTLMNDKTSILIPPSEQFFQRLIIAPTENIRIHSNQDIERGYKDNLLDNFWVFTKNRLRKFYGIPKNVFYLHLRECQFRFNLRHKNIYDLLKQMLRLYPL